MRIINVEDDFFPEAGYQINILSKYFVINGHEVIIITSEYCKIPSHLSSFFGNGDIIERDRLFEEKTGVKIIRVPIFRHVSGRAIYKPGVFRLINSLKPDILFVHGGDTYFGIRTIMNIKRLQYPVIFDFHMTYMASVNRLRGLFGWWYRFFISPKFKRNNIIAIRTANDDYVTRHLGIPENQAPYLGFGSDLQTFFPDNQIRQKTRDELNITTDDFVFLYAGKLDEFKGGLLLAEAIKEELITNKKRAVFLIIGTISSLSPEYSDKLKSMLESSSNKVITLPTKPSTELAKYYQCAEIALFPKQCSLSYFDVQACGLPVIFENNNINQSRADHNNAILFNEGSVDDFRAKMKSVIEMSDDEILSMSESSKNYIVMNFNYSHIADLYLKEIDKAIQKYQER